MITNSQKINGLFKSNKALVLIDAANLEKSAKDLGFKVDYKKLRDWLETLTSVVKVGFYSVEFKTKQHDKFLKFLSKNGYYIVKKNLKLINTKNGIERKANFDVEISVDAVDYIGKYDLLILMSGDCDFAYMINYLKGKNIIVLTVSLKYHIARELIENSNYYFDLSKIKDKIQR